MKRILLKSLLVAVGMAAGVNGAWAYDVPEGYEVKKVFFGTQSGNDVTPEDFEGQTELGTQWSILNNLNSMGLATVVEVAKPEVGTSTLGTVPTYVSGNAFQAYLRQGSASGEHYAVYSFDEISSGKLVFSGDMFSQEYTVGPIILRFADSEGNPVLTLRYNNGGGTRAFQYIVGDGDAINSGATSVYRTYVGYGIKDLVIDLNSGEVSFVFDHINAGDVREQTSVSLNIGTDKSISQMHIGKAGISSQNQYFYLDNVELYTVDVASGTYNYSVVATDGTNELLTLGAGTCKGSATYSVASLPLVVNANGKFYSLADDRVENYGVTFTMGDDDEKQEIVYAEDNTIVYFNDAENSTWPEEDLQSSGGVIGSWGNSNNIASLDLEAGLYEVTIFVAHKGGSGRNYRGEQIDVNAEVAAEVTGNINGARVYNILVEADGSTMDIYGRGTNKATDYIDYVLVRRIGGTTQAVSITGTKGLATYTPSVALDFTNAQSIAAYTATVSGITVNLTRTNTVAAGEGVLIRSLNGGPVSEDIPVAATAEPTAGNMFVGVLEDIAQLPTEEGVYTNFILNNNGDNGSGFYLANNKTVAAGKAYLRVPTESAAKISFFSLDGSITAIEGVQAEAAEGEKVYYNLNGQRVANPSKGLYILGGKKVIVK